MTNKINDINLKKVNFFSVKDNEKDLKAHLKFSIVLSLFYEELSLIFLNSIVSEFENLGINKNNITVYTVPGVFESIYTISKLLQINNFDAILCLGILIKGETKNFEYLSREIVHAISKFNMTGKIPIVYGILTVDNIHQALKRAKGEKSKHFSKTALEMAILYKNIK